MKILRNIMICFLTSLYLVSCKHEPSLTQPQQQFDSFQNVGKIIGVYKMIGKGYNSSSTYNVTFVDSIVRLSSNRINVYFPGTYYSYIFTFSTLDTLKKTITFTYNWNPTFNNVENDTLFFNYGDTTLHHNGYRSDSHSWSYFATSSK